MGWATRIIESYGFHQFLADVERGRDFTAPRQGAYSRPSARRSQASRPWSGDSGGFIGAVLDWVATEGFKEFMELNDAHYKSPGEWRDRHLLEALGYLIKQRGP